MDISRNTLELALWWVEDGLENADMDRSDYIRTRRCRDELKAYLLKTASQPLKRMPRKNRVYVQNIRVFVRIAMNVENAPLN